MSALVEMLKTDFVDFSTSVREDIEDSLDIASQVIDEAKKKKPAYLVGWQKIQKKRKKGLSPTMLRMQALKQRRRFRRRTGRKGFFLRMRPKLIRNLRKAMRAGARIKAVRHRRRTMRRAGHILKRFPGGVEKFTGRARYRRKTHKKTKKPSFLIPSVRSKFKKRRKMAASAFHGTMPLLIEAFISDRVNERIEREDLLDVIRLQTEAVESPLFPIAATVAAYIEESDVSDKFFDVDILDEALFLYFENLQTDDDLDAVGKVLEGICESELFVKEGERLDDTNVADFTVYGVKPKKEFTDKIIEELTGDESGYIEEGERDFTMDDYSSLLVLEKCVEEGVFDISENVPDNDDDEEEIEEAIYDPDDSEDVPNNFFNEKYWSAQVTKKAEWEPPKDLFAKGSASKIASTLKKASESLKQAMSRLNFYINRAGEDLSDDRAKVLDSAKNKLRKLFGKGKKKKTD